MRVRCWGTRGTLPVPSADRMEFGGNTACLEVCSGDDAVVLDAGTGLHGLGNLLGQQAAPRVHLFLSHFHWDHIQGLPFFAPLYHPAAEITIYTCAESDRARELFQTQMGAPFFPFDWAKVPARVTFHTLSTESVRVGSLQVSAFALHHPQGSLGFRVEGGGRALVYATDHEQGADAAADDRLVQAAGHADLLIHDAQYTPAEYEEHRGWGHSSWRHAAACATSAQVRRLLLFHHEPDRTDEQVRALVADAEREFGGVEAAREGPWYDLAKAAEVAAGSGS